MAQNHQIQGEFTNTSSSNQVFSTTTTTSSIHNNETSSQSITTTSSTNNNETNSQSQQHTFGASELAHPFHGTLRTESSREAYYPNGNQFSKGEQAQHSTTNSSYGLVPDIEDRSTRAARDPTADGSAGTGAGLFNTSEGHEDATHNDQNLHSGVEKQMGFLEKGSSRSSSDSSFTKYGYSGAPRGGRGIKLSNNNNNGLAHPFDGTLRTESDRETHSSYGLQSSNEEQVQRLTSHSYYGLVPNIENRNTDTTGTLTAGRVAGIGAGLTSTSDRRADVAHNDQHPHSGAEAQMAISQKISMGKLGDPLFARYGYSDESHGGKGTNLSGAGNSLTRPFGETLRAESGREPHHLDGHQPSDEEQVQHSASRSNEGLVPNIVVPNIEGRNIDTTGTVTAGGLAGIGAGLFNTSERQTEVIHNDRHSHSSEEVQAEPSKKGLTRNQSGPSSTEHIPNSQLPGREGTKLSGVGNSLAHPFDGTLRTQSGRKTYYSDGHQSSNEEQVQRSTSHSYYGLVPNIENRNTDTTGTLTAGRVAGIGAGISSTSDRRVDVAHNDQHPRSGVEAQTGNSQKIPMGNLGNPSPTKYGYSGGPRNGRGTKPSDSSNSLARPSDDTLRAEPGYETHYPDGHQSPNKEQVQRSASHSDCGLIPNIEDRSTHAVDTITGVGSAGTGAGLSITSDRAANVAHSNRLSHSGAEAQTETSKKMSVGSSGDTSSTEYDSNGQSPGGKGVKLSGTDTGLSRPFDGTLRTESGRETYYPDGHQSSNKEQVQRSTSHSNRGLAPNIEDRSTHTAGTLTASGIAGIGAGFLNSSERQADTTQNDMYLHSGVEEQTVPLEKVSTRSSSDSSFTRYGSNGRPHSKKGTKISNTGDSEYSPIERTVTRSEINTEERRNLQRALTSMSMSRQGTRHSIAEPNDPSMDPSSDSFDLRKFLRSFRHYLEGEGIEMKQLSVVFKSLNVYGSGAALQLQKTVTDMLMAPIRPQEFINFGKKERKQILHGFDGIIKAGELCVVLGRPGSGCSTLLKALTGELHGLEIDGSEVHYNGIEQHKVIKEFKGETVYNQEVDKHFPHLTVGQTLEFAAAVRTPSHRPHETSRKDFARYSAQVVMAVLGLSHTYNTKVGNDFVRGVSGGERKRVSVAEMLLAGAPFASWDNSTRGLDSATALKFVRSLRIGSDMTGGAAAVAIYQASQSVYDCFDKAAVLYEGRQIYFGPANKARDFFERQGWYCPPRQTTGDFLTAVTNPDERQSAKGYENKVPRTPEDFERYWRNSSEYQDLLREIQDFEKENPVGQHSTLTEFREKKNYIQAKHARPKSPYLISVPMQIKLNTVRAYQRIWGDFASTATQAMLNLIMALIVGSIYFGHSKGTSSFQGRGAVLFLAVLFNALTSIGEISGLYSQRPIVEKHNSYAFYHPATEAIAGIVADIPVKFIQATVFNIVLYFLAQLRYTPGQFFLYFLVTYITTFVMAAIFRSTAALTKTASQAMALAGVLVLFLVIYTGFVIRIPSMHPWFSWIRWINPVFYAFEILLANEFHGVQFPCDSFIPMGAGYTLNGNSFICNSQGAVAGRQFVSGDDFIAVAYEYSWSHVWRNFGILVGFLIFFMILYFIAVELNSSTTNTAEQLVFQRGHVPVYMQQNGGKKAHDEESARAGAGAEGGETDVSAVEESKGVFTWRDVVYDIEIKGEPRRLLDHVSGYVKPGTLTALMGVSGAGKTTLLDSLAQRTTMGVITGDMLVNGKPLDPSFQRSTGYVQQQDLHLETSTVREALRFSAVLRQPKSVPKQEKYDYVEEVIKMLNMEDFANAVVGVPGEGLNVEQRKLLTIGVELAAKPKLLLFLDEPTSGLDSQSSWSIISFLRKLASAGQAILCTIHQPSAILFQEFDRLLFLAKGGKTVYFGEIGENSQKLLNYFENSGARKCGADENPAEYMLEIVNAGKNDQGEDWFSVWKKSEAAKYVQREIDEIHQQTQHSNLNISEETGGTEFAMPITIQIWECTYRVFQQYWRMPEYVLAKILLCVVAGLFIGFSFYGADNTQAGMQNIIFSVFMLTTIFSSLVQQIQPLFITQRNLYESRERPSKAYSWVAFMIANILVELPYGIFAGILMFASFYYPVVGAGQSSARQGLVLMFSIQLLVYTSSFAAMTIAALPNAETASGLVSLLTLMSILFNGVLQTPDNLPGFWMFMYRVSPFTYWISGMVSTMLAGRKVVCSSTEVSIFDPPSGQTCGQYLGPYAQAAMGTTQNPDATASCRYCAISNADQFLASSSIYYSERWRNFGILFAFISFNVFLALLSYWLFRVLNLSNLTAKFHKTKKGAKAKGTADKAAKGAGEAARQGAHPGNRSGEKDMV